MKPSRAAVYEPFGKHDRDHFNAGRTYGVRGVDRLAVIEGLTRSEAAAVVTAIRDLDHREVVIVSRS